MNDNENAMICHLEALTLRADCHITDSSGTHQNVARFVLTGLIIALCFRALHFMGHQACYACDVHTSLGH